jgi:hypothetical protein
LTETQWIWLQCQLLLDDGFQACPSCAALGVGAYCSACGTRLLPEGATCEHCHMTGTGAYCQYCGAVLHSPVALAIEEGLFDWSAWATSLTPFLGGLTSQEKQLLEQRE